MSFKHVYDSRGIPCGGYTAPDEDTQPSESPAEHVAKLEATVKQLRAENIRLNKDLDDAGLAVAALVHQRKQLLDDFATYRCKVKDALESLNEKTTLIDIAIANSVI